MRIVFCHIILGNSDWSPVSPTARGQWPNNYAIQKYEYRPAPAPRRARTWLAPVLSAYSFMPPIGVSMASIWSSASSTTDIRRSTWTGDWCTKWRRNARTGLWIYGPFGCRSGVSSSDWSRRPWAPAASNTLWDSAVTTAWFFTRLHEKNAGFWPLPCELIQ